MTEAHLAIITPGWASSPQWLWIPDTKRQFEAAGYQTVASRMPYTRHPSREEWMDTLANAVGDRKDVTVVAHSCSGRSALHYVEDHPVRNLVIVSAFIDFIGDDMEELWRYFYSKPLDTKAIKNNCPNIMGLYSADDPVIPYDQADKFEERLGFVLRFQDQGHFLGKKLPVNLTQYLK